VDPEHLLFPHTVWCIHAGRLLEQRGLAKVVRRGAWAYYFRGPREQLVCAQLQIGSGQHESISLSQGPLVEKIVRLVRRAAADPRLRGRKFEFRTLNGSRPPLCLRVAQGSKAR
jgi:hypothetical protein